MPVFSLPHPRSDLPWLDNGEPELPDFPLNLTGVLQIVEVVHTFPRHEDIFFVEHATFDEEGDYTYWTYHVPEKYTLSGKEESWLLTLGELQ